MEEIVDFAVILFLATMDFEFWCFLEVQGEKEEVI